MTAQSSITTPTLAVLIVEDSQLDYELLVASLESPQLSITPQRVENAEEMREALRARAWDAVISDHKLPRFSSLEALAVLRDSGQDLPLIIVSGEMGEDLAVAAMHAGADDYLLKGSTARLGAALTRSIEAARSRGARQRAEAALRESEARLQAFANHLGDVRELERERIAKLVHDDIGSALTAAKLVLAHTRKRLDHAAGNEPATNELSSLKEVERIIDAVVATSHTLMRRLRPPLLDQGLVSACEWLLADFGRRTGIATRFEAADLAPLPSQIATAAYRAVEEALLNVEMHSRATKVECVIHAHHDHLVMLISDNGCGFTPQDRNRGFGLTEIAERVRVCGGEFEITTPKGGGTTIAVDLPYPDTTAGNAP